jgi:hypothetical protein
MDWLHTFKRLIPGRTVNYSAPTPRKIRLKPRPSGNAQTEAYNKAMKKAGPSNGIGVGY